MIVSDPELLQLYECRNRIAWLKDKPLLCLQCGEKFDFPDGYSWNGYNAHCSECFVKASKEHDVSLTDYLKRVHVTGQFMQNFIEGEED